MTGPGRGNSHANGPDDSACKPLRSQMLELRAFDATLFAPPGAPAPGLTSTRPP